MRIAYLDMPCGVSGDMFLAALVDAGLAPERLREALAGLAPGEWELHTEPTVRCGLAATMVSITGPGGPFPAHAYAPDHEHSHEHAHDHQHDHAAHDHTADEGAPADHHNHSHGGRGYLELREYLLAADLEKGVREAAVTMLASLAEAEAAVHGVPVEEIHFHEVGGLDTIVDLAGAAVGLRMLGVERLYAMAVPWSHGYVEVAHGRLPVPAPATVKLLEGLPVRGVDVQGETVTPTGAVLCRHLVDSWGPMPAMAVQAAGLGAGRGDFAPVPNIVRLVVGAPTGHETSEAALIADPVVLIAANLDDMQPELFEAAMGAAFDAGALDVWFTPIYMKRNRPAVEVSALAEPARAQAVAEALLRHTSTLGVRVSRAERSCLPREMVKVQTPFGEIGVKVARLRGRVVSAQPEYRDCLEAAHRHQATVKRVYAAAQAQAERLFEDG